MTPAERFAFYTRQDASGCIRWNGGKDRYGLFWHEGKTIGAHVFAYQHAHGPVPPGLFVCHTCDTPDCVNAAHLFLGTAAENSADMRKKGRSIGPRGERQGRSKLTAEQVLAIRADTRPETAIAADYGITQSHVSGIKTRNVWRHI